MAITANQISALTELFNVGMGRAAISLNRMCSASVELRVNQVKVLDAADVESFLRQQAGTGTGKIAAVRMQFSGAFSGSAELIFPADSAAHLTNLLIGDADSTEVEALKACTLLEVGNIVLNGVLGAMTNVLSEHVLYEVPTYLEATAEQLMRPAPTTEIAQLPAHPQFFLAESQFLIAEQEVAGRVSLLFWVASFETLIERADNLLRPASS
jgi:chemotaxis protein CheC